MTSTTPPASEVRSQPSSLVHEAPFSSQQASFIVRLAREDRASFEEIRERTGLPESQVIDIMRRELKTTSFRCRRKRVCGRVTKHRKLLELRLKG